MKISAEIIKLNRNTQLQKRLKLKALPPFKQQKIWLDYHTKDSEINSEMREVIADTTKHKRS